MSGRTYQEFLESKKAVNFNHGFVPLWLPDSLYGFQKELTEWAIRTGRCALFEDCGLGKTLQELVWAENCIRKTNKPVLILTPLAVAAQFVREGEKFGIGVHHSRDGKVMKGINVVNYQRLHYFDPKQFAGLVCDESSVLKCQDAKTRKEVLDFASHIDFVLLGTATPAPNDYMELGNSAEVLSVMKYNQMLAMFFIQDGDTTQQWRLRGHAHKKFWQWLSTWSRAIRRPSDLGYENGKFVLPPIQFEQHVVPSPPPKFGFFTLSARTLEDQRRERKLTIQSRCEKVASLVPKSRPFVVWCHLNAEGDLLEKLIPGAVQVSGSDDNDVKEDRLDSFGRGKFQVLITKPKIGGFGLNWQHCSDMSFFPSHSFEQFYQAVRRCHRFGQERQVTCHLVSSEAESRVLSNMQRKERQAEELYDGIVREMSAFQAGKKKKERQKTKVILPAWLEGSCEEISSKPKRRME